MVKYSYLTKILKIWKIAIAYHPKIDVQFKIDLPFTFSKTMSVRLCLFDAVENKLIQVFRIFKLTQITYKYMHVFASQIKQLLNVIVALQTRKLFIIMSDNLIVVLRPSIAYDHIF